MEGITPHLRMGLHRTTHPLLRSIISESQQTFQMFHSRLVQILTGKTSELSNIGPGDVLGAFGAILEFRSFQEKPLNSQTLDLELLGRSWGTLGRSWGALGALLGALGALLDALGALLDALGTLLGLSWGALGALLEISLGDSLF